MPDSMNNLGTTLGTSIGSSLLAVVFIVALWIYYRRRRKEQAKKNGLLKFNLNGTTFQAYAVNNNNNIGQTSTSLQSQPINTSYYPTPVINPSSTYPAPAVIPVTMPCQHSVQHFGSYTVPQLQYPPPYNPVDFSPSSSNEPNTSMANSISHMPINGTLQNQFSPLSSNKLTLL